MINPAPSSADTPSPTLDGLIQDCGGYAVVARELGLKRASVWEWVNRNGRLPWSELDGRTDYSSVLARMQTDGRLTPEEIRRLGLNL